MATKTSDRTSKNFLMEESLRIAVQKQIEAFIVDDEQQTLQFPVSFTNTQRGFVHKFVQSKGLKSKSHGKGGDRCLTIYKPNTNTVISYDATLRLNAESTMLIKRFLKDNRVSDRELSEAQGLAKTIKPKQYYYGFSTFKYAVPPRISILYDIIETHVKLPITNYRDGIVDIINSNQVVVISGDTGSGKTTQVPQFVLDDYCTKGEPCRIICTQPRRIAAVSMADRVAYERNEDVGSTVGYQIRLESKISPTSNLIYTTSGFFLRCLISDSSASWLSRITHIIMDEVHERDKYTDFLFIAVKEALSRHPKLKVILMSATIDTNIFTAYFDCPLVKIPGRMHPVDIYQLEDVLGMLGYFNQQIQSDRTKKIVVQKEQPVLPQPPAASASSSSQDDERNEMINETLQECFYGKSDFDQFFYLVTGEGVDVNVKHSETELNALMIAAINGLPDIIETLLKMGADPAVIGGLGLTAKEWAHKYEHTQCAELLEQAEKVDPKTVVNEEKIRDNQKRLQLYLDETNETEIDHVLLFRMIKFIHEQMPDGSILVFLPGYDAILEQMNAITEGDIGGNVDVLYLHGNMETSEQKKVFGRAAANSRKIILSTNIAETSLTIDDVVYVIDCGKVKQVSYDSLSESTSLTSTWISKACAKQRMGRAGRTRPGCCYRFYSKKRFDVMEEFTLPELLRIPLTELCLHARIMTKTTITDYLSKALQPPPIFTINQSIKLLKTIGALNEKEDVTELGYRLVDLPVDVQLGKMLLYAILMKCLDPVLTIVSALSVKDPFVLNFDNDTSTSFSRKALAGDSCSDLMVFIKLYQMWTHHRAKGQEYRFCRENQVSNGIMEIINGFRTQILGQLRTVGFVTNRGPGDIADLNLNSKSFAVIKACFAAGFYPNVCRVDRKVGNLKSKQEKKLLPHVTSVLRERNVKSFKSILGQLPSEWIVFEEKSRVERLCLVRNNTVVSPITIALFGGPMYIPKNNVIAMDDSDSENDDLSTVCKLILDDWIYFVLEEEVAIMVHQMRIKLNALFMKIMCNLDKQSGSYEIDSRIIDAIAAVLVIEDNVAGFKCPQDVGTRPILLPIKDGYREKRAVRKTKVGHFRNGNSALQNYQETEEQQQQQQQQQRQQGAKGSQSISMHKVTDRFRRNSIVFRKADGENNSSGSNSNVQDFDHHVANFKSAVMLQPNVRYFVLHANSRNAVASSYKQSRTWLYSANTLRNFKAIKRSVNDVDIVLFFLIPNCTFFHVGRLIQSGNRLDIQCLVEKEVSFTESRNINNVCRNQFYGSKSLDEFNHGEEIKDVYLGEQFLRFFLSKTYLQA